MTEQPPPRPSEDLVKRTRAVVALVNTSDDEGAELEAFMGLFHPDIQRDQQRMRELHEARRRRHGR